MVDRNRRNSVWFVVLFILLIFAGICAVGFWQTYDIKCGGFGNGRQWTFDKFPPQFVCSSVY